MSLLPWKATDCSLMTPSSTRHTEQGARWKHVAAELRYFPKLELIITTCSSVLLRSAKHGSQWLCFYWPTTYWNHSCILILNISAKPCENYLLCSTTERFSKVKYLSIFYLFKYIPKAIKFKLWNTVFASFHSWHICVCIYEFKDLLKDQISSFNFLFASEKYSSILP